MQRSWMRSLVLLCLTAIFLHGPAAAAGSKSVEIPLDQPLRFEHFSLEDGLSQNSVLALLQDRQGFLWIGTQDGLNRYDGAGFTIFKHETQNPNSLSMSSVISIFEDKAGILWFGTWGGGLNRYDPISGQFTRFQHSDAQPTSLANDLVTAVAEDHQGRLWVATCGGGLDLLDRQTNQFSHHRADPNNAASLSSDYVSTIFIDNAGSLWLGSGCFSNAGAGVVHFDPSNGQALSRYSASNSPNSLSSNHIFSIVQDGSGFLWLATGGYGLQGAGLDRLDPQSGSIVAYHHSPSEPSSLASDDLLGLLIDASNVLWIGTWGGGLDAIDLNTMTAGQAVRFSHHRKNTYLPNSLGSDIVWSLVQDRSGIMWIGTVNAGLDKLNPQVQRFALYRNDPADAHSLAQNAVGPILEDRQGRIWIGTLGAGLEGFDRQSGAFLHYAQPPSDPLSQQKNTFLGLYQDHSGLIWTATLAGLARFDPLSGHFQYLRNDPADPQSLVNDNVAGVVEDQSGRMWVGTLGGLDWLDTTSQHFVHMRIPELASVFSIHLDRQGFLWVGSWGQGLFRIDLQRVVADTVDYTQFLHDDARPESLADNAVFHIFEDRSGVLWLGTQGGLDRFNPDSQSFSHFQEKDGLANNTVLCILEDRQNELWISTNSGLSRFTPASGSFRNYYSSDGLQSNEFDSGSCAISQSGEMYFGGQQGLNIFKPETITDNFTPPPVAITSFKVFNQPVKVDLAGGKTINLAYTDNFISFEFAALDFHAPEKNRYAYKLEGFDRDWVEAGSRNYASYTNLAGGNYTFRVRAANNDGVWNETGASLALHISPPIWLEWWFLLGMGVALIAVASGGMVWRVNNLRTQASQLEALIQQRTLELRQANAALSLEIEQRKRAEAALAERAASKLEESEARFRAMFDNAAVGMALMTLDQKILQINQTAERITGYSEEEMRQINPSSLATEEDRQLDRTLFTELVAGQRNEYQVEKHYVHKSGRVFWGRVTYTLVRGAQGQPEYLIGLIEDIDEAKRSQERLAEQEARYRRTLEQRVAERTSELRQANAQLEAAIEQTMRAEAALAQKAADEAVVAERNRLARDLHDAVTQTLFSASLIAEVIPQLWDINAAEAQKRLSELRELTRGALAEMRTLLLELRPSALTDTALPDLLRQLTEALIGRSRLPIQLTIDGECKMPPNVQVAFYRIAQEALNNVAKYAKASLVAVNLRMDECPAEGEHVSEAVSARLSITDNGGGFDLSSVPPNHHGLRIMRERAEGIGARLSIYSEPGEGTQVTVVWQRSI